MLATQALPAILAILLGWGFNSLPTFFLNPARCGLLVLIFSGAAAAVLLGVDTNPLKIGPAPAGNENLELGALAILSLALLWFLPFADRRSIFTLHHEAWRYAGLLFFCIGVVVRLLALQSLGKYFSAYVVLQPNHRLVQQGIYAGIRHPLYLSLLLAPAGVALIFASLLSLPILAFAALFVADRVRKEEHLLGGHFGREFEDYRSRTWMLIPFVV